MARLLARSVVASRLSFVCAFPPPQDLGLTPPPQTSSTSTPPAAQPAHSSPKRGSSTLSALRFLPERLRQSPSWRGARTTSTALRSTITRRSTRRLRDWRSPSAFGLFESLAGLSVADLDYLLSSNGTFNPSAFAGQGAELYQDFEDNLETFGLCVLSQRRKCRTPADR